MSSDIQIVLASDRNFFPGMLMTAVSIISSASESKRYTFNLLVDSSFVAKDRDFILSTIYRFKKNVEVLFYNIDTNKFDSFPEFFEDRNSKMPYARILIPQLIKTEKAIYVDSDILFFKDVSKLWQIDISNYAAAVVQSASMPYIRDDNPIIKELGIDIEAPNFNSGVMVFNLDKIREEKLSFKILELLKQKPSYCKYHDQSALNIIFNNKVLFIDKSWNVQKNIRGFNPILNIPFLLEMDCNFHFVTQSKPWKTYSKLIEYQLVYKLYEHIGFEYQTPAFKRIKRKIELYHKYEKVYLFYLEIRSIFSNKGEKMLIHWKQNFQIYALYSSFLKTEISQTFQRLDTILTPHESSER